MKKIYLLMAALAASVATTQAQEIPEVSSEEAPLTLQEIPTPPKKAEGDPKAGIYYLRPQGSFYAGMSVNRYTYSSAPRIFVPPYTDMKFTAVHGSGVTRGWKYVDDQVEYNLFNPKATSTDTTITVNYKLKDVTTIDAPTLTGSGESFSDSVYAPATYLIVGAQNYGSTNAGVYTFSNHAIGIGSNFISTAQLTSNSETCLNNWKTRYSNWFGSSMELVRIKGYAEFFEKPLAPIALTGVYIYGTNANKTFDSDLVVTIKNADTHALLATLTLTQDEAEAAVISATSTNFWLPFLNMVDADGNELSELIIDEPIYVTYEFQDETTEFKPSYYQQPNIPDEATPYLFVDYNYLGRSYTNEYLSASISYTSGQHIRSFRFYLLGNYNWLVGDLDEYTAPEAGGTAVVNVNASGAYMPYMATSPNWEITLADGSALPSWITMAPTDSFDEEYVYQRATEVKIVVAAQQPNAYEREAEVKLSYKGASHIVKVKQSGLSGIENIENDADETKTNGKIYNIGGQQVNKDAKGVIIKDGKKYVVK